MKTIISTIVLLICFNCSGLTLFEAISVVESGNDDYAIGDNGKAYGRYQIWECVIDDVNKYYRTAFFHVDAFNRRKAEMIMKLYLLIHSRKYIETYKRPVTNEVLARIWNGGPEGYTKESTKRYWEKVKALL